MESAAYSVISITQARIMTIRNERSLLDALHQLLADSWGNVCGTAGAAYGCWSHFPNSQASANDAEFTPSPEEPTPSAKNSAKKAGIGPFLLSWSQKGPTGGNGTFARRYWGALGFVALGPGVKTFTPSQYVNCQIARRGVNVLTALASLARREKMA